MKRTIARSPLLEKPNVWHKHPTADHWEYGNYKCCYLSVRKTEDGKYRPSVNGSNNIRIENWVFNDPVPLEFDTLEEAQNHAFKYLDALRAKEAAEFEKVREGLKIYVNLQTTSTKV